jgi:hypothetical protein
VLSSAEREELARLRPEGRQLKMERDILAKATACFGAARHPRWVSPKTLEGVPRHASAIATADARLAASIHNLHYYVNLMREVREALDAGRFEAFRERFKADRARGVDG